MPDNVAYYGNHTGARPEKFFKTTLFQGDYLMLGLNCLEPGHEFLLALLISLNLARVQFFSQKQLPPTRLSWGGNISNLLPLAQTMHQQLPIWHSSTMLGSAMGRELSPVRYMEV